LGFQVGQSDFGFVLIGFAVSFGCYLGLLFKNKSKRGISITVFLGLAVAARFLLVFAFPNLSDDVYRFLWDGTLWHEGIHPLTYLPSEIAQNYATVSDEFTPTLQQLYPLLNSQEYYTIYPPVSQMIYYLATFPSLYSLSTGTIIIKLILFLFECGTLYLGVKMLKTLKLDPSYILLYALNPLVIIEITGNLHFEGIMLFFFIGSMYWIAKERIYLSATSLALSIGAKLLPLMFLPAILLYVLKKSRVVQFLSILFISFGILFFVFFISLDVLNLGKSLDLYFQKFEFNASVYYLTRFVGKFLTGYNQIRFIGPFLSLLAVAIIVFKAFDLYKMRHQSVLDLIDICFMAFVTYLVLATTVHPWYLLLPIGLTIFRPRLWIIVWSFMIVLSYSTYADPNFSQNYWLIALEYGTVLLVWVLEKIYPNQMTLTRV